jgi:hypothetical protein
LAAKPPGIAVFERQFFNHMMLALDHYFLHRSRNMEGKDGNPLKCGCCATRSWKTRAG